MAPVEPRVARADVRRVLLRALQPGIEGFGDSVALLAGRADTSTRTVYRVLDTNQREPLSLDLADRLLVAADGHISECELVA